MALQIDEIGVWSEVKLDIIRRYALEYSKIVSANGFYHVYIDAFAGAGKHSRRKVFVYRVERGIKGHKHWVLKKSWTKVQVCSKVLFVFQAQVAEPNCADQRADPAPAPDEGTA